MTVESSGRAGHDEYYAVWERGDLGTRPVRLGLWGRRDLTLIAAYGYSLGGWSVVREALEDTDWNDEPFLVTVRSHWYLASSAALTLASCSIDVQSAYRDAAVLHALLWSPRHDRCGSQRTGHIWYVLRMLVHDGSRAEAE